MKWYPVVCSLPFLLFCILSYHNKQVTVTEDTSVHDPKQIKDSDELVVLTLYSSTSHPIHRGRDMDFQCELSGQFTKNLDVGLRIEVARNIPELIRKLLNDEGDLIVYNISITKELKNSLIYCGEEMVTRQVIVQ